MLADCDIRHRESSRRARIRGEAASTAAPACNVTTFGVQWIWYGMKRRTAPTFESMASTSLMQKKCFAACLSWTPTHGRTTANVGGRDLALSVGGLRTWSLHTEILRPSG